MEYSPSEIIVVIVIPCFNEEKYLFNTCISLGFGNGIEMSPKNTILILVNNNSTDSTGSISEKIKKNSAENSVIVGFESEQGFVPARRRGNLIARNFAISQQIPLTKILIVQADADTIYSKNYTHEMRLKAQIVGHNTLIEACVDYEPPFKELNKQYVALCNQIDNELTSFFQYSLLQDVIVDDKAAAYRLSDYFNWNSHRREYHNSGDEIYAETTRLYISAVATGAKKVLVDNAVVFHSARKIVKNPILHFATAGFPRELSWNIEWEKVNKVALTNHFTNLDDPIIRSAIFSRKQHLVSLFIILPLHINKILKIKEHHKIIEFATMLHSLLPERTLIDLQHRPSIVLSDAFELVGLNGFSIVDKVYEFGLRL